MSKQIPTTVPRVIVLSGGTGRTGKQLLTAALAQFPDAETEIVYETKVKTIKRAKQIVSAASAQNAVICQSLVQPKVRQAVDTETLRLGVPCIDALGPSLALLSDRLGMQPLGRPGLMYQIHREQIDRMEAMDFTLAHDDGQRMSELDQADVILVGASRTTKSVTCCYLAFRGLRAANVPIIPGNPVPAELSRLDPPKVIGLTMNAAHLASIRQARLSRITHRRVGHYADRREIQRELLDVSRVMKTHRWRMIDVSYKATEEVAKEIMGLLNKMPPRRRPKEKHETIRAGGQ